jgi:DNA gyrase subunit B/topoisomerase-4 subunit B
VEGESAALGVARMRDARTQAVLPMQGKPLNAARATPRRIAAHPHFAALAAALETGLGDAFALDRARYGRVILLMDPDADGIHCGALMLMFFHRCMRPLLEAGRVLMARPPWGEVTYAGEDGPRHAWSDEEFAALCAELRRSGRDGTTLRYRGLAGLDPAMLAASCLDPATRRTAVMTVRDAEMAIALFNP